MGEKLTRYINYIKDPRARRSIRSIFAKFVDVDSATPKVNFAGNAYSGAASASGLLMGLGTSTYPATSSTADDKFIEFRCKSSATSGDNRLAYLRYELSGAAGGGETFRALTYVSANIGTAHGAHISLSFSAVAGGSECSGLGAAVRGTLHMPNIASWAPTGSLYSGMFEIYSDGTASDPAGLTDLAFLCISNSGDATGKADVDTDASLFSIQGFTAAADTTKVLTSVSLAELPAGTVGLRVKVGSTLYYMPLVAATAWN